MNNILEPKYILVTIIFGIFVKYIINPERNIIKKNNKDFNI